jgi:hypothetical protein
MLTKLGESLGGWRPRATPGGDPLSLIRSAWTGLVGADVAKAAQPVAIQGEVLIVLTASSAWSHQLTFLEPEIVRGVRALPGGVTIAKLRFRVGTITSPVPGVARRRAARPARSGVAPAPGTPRTAAEALARFRAVVERRRARHRAAGGRFCSDCGAAIGAGTACLPCADAARGARTAACERLLYEAPWLAPEHVLAMVPGLDAGDYDAIRRRLLRAWWDEMALAHKRARTGFAPPPDRSRLRKIASSYVLLETKIDPNRLEMNSAVRRNALGDLFDFIIAVETSDESQNHARRRT